MDLNKLRDQAYKSACDHGFHDEPYSIIYYKCLIISELMEAVEADRTIAEVYGLTISYLSSINTKSL